MRPLGNLREITRNDVVQNVIGNLSRQDEKESAVSVLERAANVRRGTIRAVQTSLQPIEARTAAQERATSLPERLQRHRVTRALAAKLPGLVARLRRHGEFVVQLAKAGSALAEQLAAIARAKRAEHKSEFGYWRDVAARASKTPEQVQVQSRTRRPGKRR
jgi:hypothetical protein